MQDQSNAALDEWCSPDDIDLLWQPNNTHDSE